MRHFRRGTSILPSLFTTGNLFLGLWAIVKTLDGQFAVAAPLIGAAVILDILDGLIARLTNTQSEFGAQYDSLADAVSFGVAPALLAHAWGLGLVPPELKERATGISVSPSARGGTRGLSGASRPVSSSAG